MTKAKLLRQQRALERLTSTIAKDMSRGSAPTLAQRDEYNRLKKVLAAEGLTHEGYI